MLTMLIMDVVGSPCFLRGLASGTRFEIHELGMKYEGRGRRRLEGSHEQCSSTFEIVMFWKPASSSSSGVGISPVLRCAVVVSCDFALGPSALSVSRI